MPAILVFILLVAHTVSIAMDTPELKKNLDPTIWRHLPTEMRNKVLFTHVIDAFESPEYTSNINIHIRNMRTVCKESRNFIQKPETMSYIFQQLEPVNIDIRNILTFGAEFSFAKAVRAHNIAAINLSLIYNHVPNCLSSLLALCDKAKLNCTLRVITQDNSFRAQELHSALVKAHKERNTQEMKVLYECQAPMESISFIAELKPESRTPQTIQYIQQMITDHFNKHVILPFNSDTYHCMLPITTAPLLCLAIGDYKLTKQLLEYGIDPHNDTALTGNIIQKKDDCVALLLEHIDPNSSNLLQAVCSKNAFAVKLILKKNKNISDTVISPLLSEAIMNSHKETVKPLLEYIQDQQIKLDAFKMVKYKMMEQRKAKKSKPFNRTKNPIKSIFAIFCKHLNISYDQAIKDIDREMEAYDD